MGVAPVGEVAAMRGFCAGFALFLPCLVGLTDAAYAVAPPEKRVALVIGNNEYQNFVGLSNPANHAENLKKAVECVNFQVIFHNNTDLRRFLRALQDFNKRAKDA